MLASQKAKVAQEEPKLCSVAEAAMGSFHIPLEPPTTWQQHSQKKQQQWRQRQNASAAQKGAAEQLGPSQEQKPASSRHFMPAQPAGLVLTRDAAEIGNQQQQQQDASSAGNEGSASLAIPSGPRRKQAGSASSSGFTPAQRAVAVALRVVLQRVVQDGKGAVPGAKRNLCSNNPATCLFLMMLPDDGQFPTMQQVEQKASGQLLEDLSKLVKQCEAAGCQPLEVFTRSVQCSKLMAGVQRNREMKRVRRRHERDNDETCAPLADSVCQQLRQDLQQLGAPESLADLMEACWQIFARHQDVGKKTVTLAESELDHMLPGQLQCLGTCLF